MAAKYKIKTKSGMKIAIFEKSIVIGSKAILFDKSPTAANVSAIKEVIDNAFDEGRMHQAEIMNEKFKQFMGSFDISKIWTETFKGE